MSKFPCNICGKTVEKSAVSEDGIKMDSIHQSCYEVIESVMEIER